MLIIVVSILAVLCLCGVVFLTGYKWGHQLHHHQVDWVLTVLALQEQEDQQRQADFRARMEREGRDIDIGNMIVGTPIRRLSFALNPVHPIEYLPEIKAWQKARKNNTGYEDFERQMRQISRGLNENIEHAETGKR